MSTGKSCDAPCALETIPWINFQNLGMSYLILVTYANLGNQLFQACAAEKVLHELDKSRIKLSSFSPNINCITRLALSYPKQSHLIEELAAGHLNQALLKSLGPLSELYKNANRSRYFVSRKISDVDSFYNWMNIGRPRPLTLKGFFQNKVFYNDTAAIIVNRIISGPLKECRPQANKYQSGRRL